MMDNPIGLEEAMYICATQPINTREWEEAKQALMGHYRRLRLNELRNRRLEENG